MVNALATLFDTIPTHWRLARTRQGPAAHSRPGLRFLDLDRHLVRLRQAGTRGPSLVFAADPPVPIELYDELIASVADRYRVTVIEVPGFGCSLPRMGFRYSMRSAVAGIVQILEALEQGPHVLVMPCVTGFAAIGAARARPDLVRALVLPQTPDWDGAQRWLDGRDPKGLLRRPIYGQLALAALRRQRTERWYATALGDRTQASRYAAATLTHFDQGGCFCLASAFQDFLRDAQGQLGPVAQDTLLLWGNADPSHRDTDPEHSRRLAPRSRLVRFDGVGHFPELENPAAFIRELDQFLNPEHAS